MGHTVAARSALVLVLAASVVGIAACGSRLLDPAAASSAAAAPAELGEPVAAESSAGAVGSVDFGEAIYLSVCGLSEVRVSGGVGEASTVGNAYGVEVVDVALGDLDGDQRRDAAVLVDCLGGDTWSARVLVVPADGVLAGDPPRLAVAAGGVLAPGDRPLEVALAGAGIEATVLDAGAEVVRNLSYEPDVLVGGEVPVSPGQRISGVITSLDGATAVVAVTPDAGHRFAIAPGLVALDPATGATVGPDAMVGRPAVLTVAADGSIAAVELAPPGGA